MGNRCENCMKFVSLENGDPEVQMEVGYNDGSLSISFEVTHTRNCTECSSEMKTYSDSGEEQVALEDIEVFKALNEKSKKKLKSLLKKSRATIEIDTDDAEVNESGGSRYKANDITIICPYTITITCNDKSLPETITHSGSIEVSTTAGSYDDY